MDINEKFLKFIKENNLIDKNDNILLGFSGGKDSVFLADLLLRNSFNFALAHLNHNLRGEESKRDLEFCQAFAQKRNLQIFVRSVDIKKIAKENGLSIEEAGRLERYRFFEEISRDYGFNKIATAHHFDDNVETFFINFLRKKSIFSLKGIRLKEKKIIRPILIFKRTEIEKYISENNLEYVEDSSNFDVQFLRNRIRLNLIPYIDSQFNVDVLSIVDFYQSQIKEIEEIINHIIREIFKNSINKENSGIVLNLKNISEFWRYKLIRYEIYKNILLDLSFRYSEKFLHELDKFITGDKTTGRLLKHNIKIFKEYSKIFFTSENLNNEDLNFIIPSQGNYEVENKTVNLEVVSKRENDGEYLDFAKVKFPLKIRHYKNGDRFIPLGMKKEVKLKDFFINQKIPYRKRRNLLIFEDSEGDIIYIENLRISEKVKFDNNTEKFLKIKIILN